VVRNLTLHYISRKEGSRLEPEKDSTTLAVAFLLAEGRKDRNQRVSMLSKISFPFWIVQTSETKSIVLAAAANTKQEFKFSDTKGATEIRRIMTSGVSQPEDVPSAMTKVESLLQKTDVLTIQLLNLFNSSPIASVGHFITEAEPAAKPIRLEMKADSPEALKRTEEFREVAKAAKVRVEAIESLQKVMDEKIGGHLKVLENLKAVEAERWNVRIKTMEERTRQECIELAKNEEKQLYDLREKTKMDLRALTAEFSRSVNDLESFFAKMIDDIRATRTQIGQKEDDVDSAVNIYKELATNLTSKIQHINQPLQIMADKSENMRRKSSEIVKAAEARRITLETSTKSQIEERNQRLADTKAEMQNKMHELDELQARVKNAFESGRKQIEERIMALQREYLNLMAWSLENETVKGLMPLTLLDVEVFIARYDGGSYLVLTPSYTPDSEFTMSTTVKSLNQEFDEALRQSLESWLRLDPSMKNNFDNTCNAGNLLLTSQSAELLADGLETLRQRKIIKNMDKEKYEALWNKYTGKCPKCGSTIETGSKFCQKCGFPTN
jgi:hypothetical protein